MTAAADAERDAALAGRLADSLDGLAADWLTIVIAYREDLERDETVDPSDDDIVATIKEWWTQDQNGAEESPIYNLDNGGYLNSSEGSRVRRALLHMIREDWCVSRILAAVLYCEVGQ